MFSSSIVCAVAGSAGREEELWAVVVTIVGSGDVKGGLADPKGSFDFHRCLNFFMTAAKEWFGIDRSLFGCWLRRWGQGIRLRLMIVIVVNRPRF